MNGLIFLNNTQLSKAWGFHREDDLGEHLACSDNSAYLHQLVFGLYRHKNINGSNLLLNSLR